MEINEFWQLVRQKKSTIFTIIIVSLVIVLSVSLLTPAKYGAQTKILVMQEGFSADAYTISRNNEYLGKLFSQIIYSSSFYNFVMNDDTYRIDQYYFNGNESEQLKIWRKTISTKTYGDTGIIEINVYHPIASQAKQIALTITNTLRNQGHNYLNNDNIEINVIDQPIVSDNPIKPNIPYNIIVTLLLSLMIALILIYIFPERKYDLRLFKKRRREDKNKRKTIPVENIRIEEREEKKQDIKNDNQFNSNNSNLDLDEYYRKLANNNQERKEELEEENLSGDISNIIK
jgi:capsular polysaccharide biosynthesis protein